MSKHFSLSSVLASVLALGIVLLVPVAHAQEVQDVAAESLQGGSQGTTQGAEQGGPTLASLGLTPDESGAYDTSVLGENDPRQGALQGVGQGEASGSTTLEVSNEGTGADSTNASSVTVSGTSGTSVANASDTSNAGFGTANTGQNSASENTGSSGVTTGSSGVGVQQVTADNLNTAGSYGDIGYGVSAGSQSGDLVLDFNPQSGGDFDESFRATNTVTGSGSDNTAEVTSHRETLLEIQNDGTVVNTLDAAAITGQNDVSQNTGNASVSTGNANVAATLLNFLNVNVVDGALWLDVVDIFGDLNGNIVIPEEAIAYLERRQRELLVEVSNAETGADSTNMADVDVAQTELTEITNTAGVENNVNIDAITGQNSATRNTGGSTIATGDVLATTNTVTLANMNVVDGNLGLIIVNALNRWLGFLLGSDGIWTPIDHDYSTVVAAENSSTGANSTNAADIDVASSETTQVTNDASITNTLDLAAITGQNTVNQNTGNASVRTGDARVNATVVNVVNTNVVRGGFFTAVVNVFGNWFGDLFFGNRSVRAFASSGADSEGGGLMIQAENANTGLGSENIIDVAVESESVVTIENTATIENNLTVNADTGHNEANRNTGLGSVDTGDVLAVLHARNMANSTLVGIPSAWGSVTAELVNDTTGADSTNTIDVTVNDERHVTVLNDAVVDTAMRASANTGFNTVNRNTLGGLVMTGAANIEALVENLLNQTWLTGYEYGDNPVGHSIEFALANENTGSGSTNANTVDPNVSTEVDIGNDADVDNDVHALATTGNNQASRNTGGGAVRSGTAGIGGSLDNAVNQTEVLGSSGGSFDLDADNVARIENALIALAFSGENEANRNTGSLSLSPTSEGGSSSSGGGSVLPSPPPSGVGGGGLVSGVSDAFSLSGYGSEGGEERTPKVKPVLSKKPAVKTAGKVAAAPSPSAGKGELGGGPTWEPVARTVLRIPEAQAAQENQALSSTVRSTAGGVTSLGHDWTRMWSWALLLGAFALGIGSTRRTRVFFQRFTGRG